MSSNLATPEVVERFHERVARDLERHPLDLEPAEHRRRVAAALGRCGRGDHYELLEVSHGASEGEIHAAFEALARLVHPGHAGRIGLEGRAAVAEVLFEHATEAYLVLSDPHRRGAYDRSSGRATVVRREGWQSSPERVEERAEEARRLARELHDRAESLAEREDFHYALELLRQAVRVDPEAADSWALLGRCQARNPKWLHMAGDSLRRALHLRPDSIEYRLALAEVATEDGDGDDARRLLAEILSRQPGHPAATEALEALDGSQESDRAGLFGRLRR